MREDALYLLRMWRDGLEWRATIEDLRQGQKWHFAHLEDCWTFLDERSARWLPQQEEPS